MTQVDLHQRLMALFDRACELNSDAREEFLARECGSDAALRAELEAMLRMDAAGDVVDQAAGGAALRALAREIADKSLIADGGPPPFAQIGNYRVLRRIGSGGMGDVFIAEQDNPRRHVALKLIRLGAANTSQLRRFELEAGLLGRLHHPGIAQIYEAGVAHNAGGPQPFIAMELIDGLPLTEYAEKRKLNTVQRLALMAKVADAVQHAHQRGIIHRDLKPANILVVETDTTTHDSRSDPSSESRVGQPKILDFGVARAIDPEMQFTTIETHVGQLIGTLPYMSPEQVASDPNAIDTRSDVYALGVLLYQLLTRSLPHDLKGRSMADALRIIQEEPLTRLSAIDATLRGDIETIVRKALERDKERRYASALDFAQDIRRFIEHQPIIARPASTAYRVRKFAQRHKFAVTLGSLTALALIVATAVSMAMAMSMSRHADSEAYQRKVAEDIGTLLTGMLDLANPHASGPDTTVVDMLNGLMERLDQQENVLPEVEASVRATAAETYLNLEMPEQALAQFQKAVALQRAVPDGVDFLGAMLNEMGMVYTMQRDYAGAERTFREALSLLGPMSDETSSRYESGYMNLAEALFSQDKFEEAAKYYSELNRLLSRNQRDPVQLVGAIRRLSMMHERMGKFDLAEAELREALVHCAKIDEKHPIVSATYVDLADVLRALERLPEACPMYEKGWLLAGTARRVGSRDWCISHRVLLKCYVDLGRHEQAEQHVLLAKTALAEASQPAHEYLQEMQQVLGAGAEGGAP